MSEDPENKEVSPLTDAQVEAILKAWQEGGEKRLRNFGAAFSEEDFIAGAMTVFFALESQDRMPASWAFFGLSKNSHFRRKKHQKEARDRAYRITEHANAIMNKLQDFVEGGLSVEYGQNYQEARESLLATIRLVDPGWAPRIPEEDEDDY